MHSHQVTTTFDNATVISSLPFSDSLNTEEATTAADDPSSNCFGEHHTVWYSFTPDEDVTVQADTISDYSTTLSVHTGSRGSLQTISCSGGGIILEATAGVTYYFMVGSDDIKGGGNLVFNVDVIDIPNVEVNIDPTGTVSARTGEVTVSGTVTCSDATTVELNGDVQQRRGRSTIQQSLQEFVSCASGEEPTPWSATFTGENGRFLAGQASVTIDAIQCSDAGCAILDHESKTVQLVRVRSR